MKDSLALSLVASSSPEEVPINAIDRHFARLMLELNGQPSPELELAAQWVSAWREAGHICVPLRTVGSPGLASKLRQTRVVGGPGEARPLILDSEDRLYLQRYWEYEDQLARAIKARLRPAEKFDAGLLTQGLERFFGRPASPNEQRRAAATAVEKNFCVITGGPGTGKTRTVLVILALLVDQFMAQGRKPRMALAAPTGKAAARLKESLERTAEELQIAPEVRAAMPAEAQTLHRLLGAIPDSPYFRHDAEHPLAVDVVIIDEASMVDLALMAKVVAAVPGKARLILLGDKDQLASVEAGYVLGDICHLTRKGAADAAICEHIVELKTNYRFGPASGIHRLSTLINAGAGDELLRLRNESYPDVRFAALPRTVALAAAVHERVIGRKRELDQSASARPPETPAAGNAAQPADLFQLELHLGDRVGARAGSAAGATDFTGYRAYRETDDPREALKRFGEFRVLAALRRGPFGVQNLNRLAEEALAFEGLIRPESGTFYPGRPVLVLRNDAQLKLFNGDVGLILPDREADGELRAFFLDARGELRRVLPARLPEHETVFAMTVHKSQGSEFERVLLVLPDKESPVVTRELVYTGVTRARKLVELWFDEEILRVALQRRIERSSGLRDALWGEAR